MPKQSSVLELNFMEKYRVWNCGPIKDGKEKKNSKLEYHKTPPLHLIQYLKPWLKEFVLHNYVARWQDAQFRKLLNNVFNDMVVCCIDFSENDMMKIQNKIQNMH